MASDEIKWPPNDEKGHSTSVNMANMTMVREYKHRTTVTRH